MNRKVVMAALMVLLAGSWGVAAQEGEVVAQEGEGPTEEAGVRSQMEEKGSGCGCRNRFRAASDDNDGCPGRGSGRGGGGIQRGEGPGQGAGKGIGRGPGWGAGQAKGCGPGARAGAGGAGCGGGCNRDVMQAIRTLVHQYRADIVREVEDVPNGVVTVTRSPENSDAVEALQRHVAEMKTLIESGGRMRVWDPLFSEIFDHYDEIEMNIEDLEDGVRVTETSENPEVVKLIRAHARKVNEFVARGPEAVHEPTSLPDDYRDSE